VNLDKATYALLTGRSELTTLTSRIYNARAPGGAATPYVVFAQSSAQPLGAMDGPNALELGEVQIDVYAATKADALLVAKQVRLATDGIIATAGGVVVRGTMRTGQFAAEPLAPADGSDGPIYRVVVLVSVFFEQAIG